MTSITSDDGTSLPLTDARKALESAREALAAAQKRAEALHDILFEAREAIRLKLSKDSPAEARDTFNSLHSALYIVRGDPLQMHMTAALAAIDAALASGEQGWRTMEFGLGKFLVDTGTAYEKPAVFIRPAPEPGPVGELAPQHLRSKGPGPLAPNEFYMTFPTMEQAERVADALVAAPPAPETRT